MADVRRISEIYLNTERHRQVTAQNTDVRNKLTIFRGTNVLIRAHLKMDSETEYFEPNASSVWAFRVDNSYEQDHDDLLVSDNDQFNNAADWDELDIDGGKICWRIATNTKQLATALGSEPSDDMYAELWMTAPGEDTVLVCHWDITVHNIATEVGDSVDLIYSRTDIIGQDGEDTVVYYPDGSVAKRYDYRED